MLWIGAVLGLAVGAAPAVAGPASAAAAVTCGEHVTADARLDRNLLCDTGLRIDPGVTLDLHGHTLAGPGAGTAVTVTPGEAEVVIRNGGLRGWGIAVAQDDTAAPVTLRLSGLDVTGGGFFLVNATATVERSTIRDGGVGAIFSPSLRVVDSTISGAGVAGAQVADVSVIRSTLRDSRTAVDCSESACSVTDSRIVGNEVGLRAFQTRFSVQDNVFRDNGVGYDVSFNDGLPGAPYVDVVQDNRFTGNDLAVRLGPWTGAALRRNAFTGNGTGISADLTGDAAGSPFAALLERNRLTGNGNGIVLEVPAGTASLGDNRAVGNDAYGIHAPGAVDLGGNFARGNGRDPQCEGVAC